MSNNVVFQSINTMRASEAIYAQIRSKILSGELVPGDKLPSERLLMDMFERSRPTIREALRMLTQAGLIKATPGSAAVVLTPGTHTLEQPLENMIKLNQISYDEFCEFRFINEHAFVRWACKRRTNDDLEKIREILDYTVSVKNNLDEYIPCNARFHNAIAAAGHNQLSYVISKVTYEFVENSMFDHLKQLTKQKLRQEVSRTIEIHTKLFQAVKDQATDHALVLVKQHENDFQQIIKMIQGR